MRYLSVCSGIEAASVAWHDFGWTPLGFAEIEPFPSAVLKERFPNVPNYGDITKYKQWPIEPGTVDVLAGGPPCQAFSVAGLREGMADPRGNLSLTYVGMVERFKPKWIIYENVPGLLSSNGGKDFASLTTALANIGYSFAYRILDAQYFGIPQRRRRIFLIGSRTGDWRYPTAVLFDGQSVFGNPTQKPKSWQGTPPTSGTSVKGESRINCTPDGITGTVSAKWSKGTGGPAGDEHYNLITQPKPIAFKTRTGGEYSGVKGGRVRPTEKGGTGLLSYEDKTFTIAATQDQYVATPISYSIREDAKANTFSVTEDDVALCVTKVRPSPQSHHAQNFILQPNQVMFRKSKRASSADDNETWVADNKSNTLNNFDVGDVRTTHAVVYENHPNDSRVTGPHDVAPTVTSRYGTGGGNVPLVQSAQGVDLYNQTLTGDIHPPLRTATGHGAPAVAVAFQPGNLCRRAGSDPSTEVFPTLSKDSGDQNPHVAHIQAFDVYNQSVSDVNQTLSSSATDACHTGTVFSPAMAVRRLTPNECLALQGFPRDWTKISWKGKPAEQCPDGPQYKAAGNSMAVPCMRWIGERIMLVEQVIAEVGNNK
jgi:DNA-cytosine methyltransferase